MRKIRSSTKIFVGFLAVTGAAWFSYNKIQDLMIMGQKFAPIAPERVNIVGVNPGGKYKVIIANEVAQLVEAPGGFQEGDTGDTDEGSDSGGAVKKKISIKDMLGSLQGNGKSLSAFVTAMNDLNENDLPPIRVIWTKPDLEKALNGDPTLGKKLEQDLNIGLDGTPLPVLNVNALQNGIVLQIPVTVNVNVAGTLKPLIANVLFAYKSQLAKAVETDVAQDQGKIDNSTFAGYYKEEAEKVNKLGRHEGVKQFLSQEISEEHSRELARYPEELLSTAFVVVNNDFITGADYSTSTSPNGKPLYDLHIHLNDEGRRRLWQYTRHRVGDQLLLTSDGVAIAAARVHQPLMGGDVTITHMTDQGLLDDFISNVKNPSGGEGK